PHLPSFPTRRSSDLGAGDLRSRTLRVDLHVELHDVKNRGPADSPPCLARLAQISFNWRDPSSKMSKVVASRDTKLDSGRESTNRDRKSTRLNSSHRT